MAQRQLNIRSDEAYRRASSLSKRLGKSTTEVVVDALRSYETSTMPRDGSGMTADQRADYEALIALARQAREHIDPEAPSGHDWLYDENGLPK